MSISELSGLGAIVAITAVLYMAWQLYRTGKKPESLGEWAVQAQAAKEWAVMAVTASDQLWKSDQIGAEERFDHADMFLQETLPNLTAHQRTMLIEGAVGGLKEARARGWLPTSGTPGTPEVHAHKEGTEHTRSWEDMTE